VIIEIKGVEFENKGANLMLLAIIEQITRIWPQAEIALTHSKKASYAQRSAVASLRKVNVRKNILDMNISTYFFPRILRKLCKRNGIVFEVDVDMIIDASGFSYSDQWSSKLRIYHLKNELKRFYRYSKPYIFLPQAFGPFTLQVSRRRIADSFKYAAMICAREKDSFQHVKSLTGSIERLFQYGDFTNLIDGFVPSNFDSRIQWACIVPNKNMINPRNGNKAWIERYEPLLKEAIVYYRKKGLKPFFLNHEGKEDAAIIESVNRTLVTPIPVVTESDPLAVKGIVGASRAVLCSRYHGCVSAMSQGICCIGTSWSHKYELLYEEYRARDLLIEPDISVEGLHHVIDLSLEKDNQTYQSIAVISLELKAKSVTMWSDFQSIAEDYPPFKEQRRV